MKSTSQNVFATVSDIRHPRSVHNRRKRYRTTFSAGKLIPFFCELMLPGDSVNLSMTAQARFSTLVRPLMDDVFLTVQWFAVPVRIIWPNFVKMMGERDNPDDSIDYHTPQVDITKSPLSSTGWPQLSNADYMGIPTKIAKFPHSSLGLRALRKVYNDWYRHPFCQDSLEIFDPDYPDGPDDPSILVDLLDHNKPADYFRSCLPTPQGLEDAVLLPLGDTAPIIGLNQDVYAHSGVDTTDRTLQVKGTTNLIGTIGGSAVDSALRWSTDPDKTGLVADLSEAQAPSVNSVRLAIQLQHAFEMEARGGMRYIEQNRVMFGVVSDDARMQRSEFLQTGTTRMNTHPVPQTSASESGSPQASLAAFATAGFSGGSFGCRKSFKEHCILLGIMHASAVVSYQQGCPRWLKYDSRYDYPTPIFSHCGEQPVYNYEIYAQGNDVIVDGNIVDNQVFGYIGRFDERRYGQSQNTGLFRSNATGSLDVYHLGLDFDSLPEWGSDFIKDAPPTERVKKVITEPDFILDSVIEMIHAQAFPARSNPGLMDHSF